MSNPQSKQFKAYKMPWKFHLFIDIMVALLLLGFWWPAAAIWMGYAIYDVVQVRKFEKWNQQQIANMQWGLNQRDVF